LSQKLIDPRIFGIRTKTANVKNIIGIVSSKGGVGKTTISTLLAIALNELGLKTGLLDLDLTNPNTHLILGADMKINFEEENGIKPVIINEIKYFSPVILTEGRISPLRGREIDSALKELLSILDWGSLDFLIIDTPPGMSDELYDLIELLPQIKLILVSSPDKLSLESIKNMIKNLEKENAKILGIVVNLYRTTFDAYKNHKELLNKGLKMLKLISYDDTFIFSLGSIDKVKNTTVFKEVYDIALEILKEARKD
jgi:ATP-binding protein involved in chromosome partitioning